MRARLKIQTQRQAKRESEDEPYRSNWSLLDSDVDQTNVMAMVSHIKVGSENERWFSSARQNCATILNHSEPHLPTRCLPSPQVHGDLPTRHGDTWVKH